MQLLDSNGIERLHLSDAMPDRLCHLPVAESELSSSQERRSAVFNVDHRL